MDEQAVERRQRVTEAAADWWIRLKREDLPREQREQFIDWLRESPLHVGEMLRIAQIEGALEQFQGWTRIATEGSADDNVIELRSGATPPQHPASRRHLWSLAAVVALTVSAAAWFIASLGVIETERGERREVVLADGSVLQISPETTLRVEMGEQQRRVSLERGAALFKVAKDPARPFIVTADDTIVRAVGTAFGVEHRPEGIVVTVAEGRIEVDDQDPFQSGAVPLMLTAGDQIAVPPVAMRADSAAPRIAAAQVRKVDAARELAWAEGRLVFDQRPVAGVITEFNRYNRIQLRVTDAALAQRPVSGVFDASDPESFIAFIATAAPVQVERGTDNEITLSTR